ncbi:hypothetical protein ACS0TY_019040 [Phlomoides rotata]
MAVKRTSLRVLIFPWLAHGHIFPFLELAKILSRKNFHIYLCSTPINLDSIKNNLQTDSSDHDFCIELVEHHLPSLPELPPHYHTTKNLPPHLLLNLINAFHNSSPNFSEIITNLKPDLLIYDGFQPWSAKTASSQGIPSVHFSTSSSTAISFFHHTLLELSFDIVLIKSCRGIQGKYMDHLSTLCNKKIVPTGPLITFAQDQENADSDIIKWLSERNIPLCTIHSGAKETERDGCAWMGPTDCDLGASKCGWSSVMESVYFGVPLVALPLKLDQPLNARLVVEAGVGVEVVRDEDGGFDGLGMAKAINEVIAEE